MTSLELARRGASDYASAVMPRLYLVRASVEFSAAHVLHGYPGGCNRIHGHNFKVHAEVEASDLDEVGMAIDFTALEALLAEIAQPLDHRLLNEVGPFCEVNPTAEHIAAYFWSRLQPRLQALVGQRAVRLRTVRVQENDRTCVTYQETA